METIGRKNKYGILGYLTIIILIFLSGYFIGFNQQEDITTTVNINNDFKSQCYTNLEPSNFLSAQRMSVITENHIQNYIKIDIEDREFFYMQTSGTGSMRPFLQKAASVILIKPEIQDIEIGDVIIFDCEEKNVIHRVIKIENGIYTTKGDNNNNEDTKCIIKFENITGRLVGVLY